MKVPFPANSQINSISDGPSTNNNINTTPPNNTGFLPASSSPYEPKSVLDLRGSPSPITDRKPVSNIISAAAASDVILAVDPFQLADDDVLINPQLDDFDSLMRDWGLHDDYANYNRFSEIQITDRHFSDDDDDNNNNKNNNSNNNNLSEFSQQFVAADYGLLAEIPGYDTARLDVNPNSINSFENISGDLNWNAGIDYVDELIRLAECFDTNSLQLGHVILAQLNQRLRSPDGKPLQRAAFYFKEALQSLLLTGSNRPSHHPASTFEIVQIIKAQKTFLSVSPVPLFAGFTANQAVLEALDGGSMKVHVIDFDIGLGGHWASFMKELADRATSRNLTAPSQALRISALVPEEYAAESGLIRENLALFARELNIRFEIDFVLIRTFEYLSFKAFKFMEGEKVAVILSPAIFRQVGTGFLNDLRRVSPHVVVHVDVEGKVWNGTTSYRRAVINSLEFYSTLLESLEAANSNGVGDWMRRVEALVVYPKILEGVKAGRAGRGTMWSEGMVAAGLRQVGLSQFAEFQAECLLRRVQISGFHVAKRQGQLLLCWHDRPLVAMSAWRF
ncbi:hypothetical protein OROGR_018080 [Orobanche gracilis]